MFIQWKKFQNISKKLLAILSSIINYCHVSLLFLVYTNVCVLPLLYYEIASLSFDVSCILYLIIDT